MGFSKARYGAPACRAAGLMSEDQTEEEALANIADAISTHLSTVDDLCADKPTRTVEANA